MSSEMQWVLPVSWGSNSSMNSTSVIERAKEELEILELQYPNRFQYLKIELKTFISDFESQNLLLNNTSISSCHSAQTQESSSQKKRKKSGNVNNVRVSMCGASASGCNKKMGKTDEILQRAQQCLHKIQKFKSNYYKLEY